MSAFNKPVGALGFLFFFTCAILSSTIGVYKHFLPTAAPSYVSFHPGKGRGLGKAERDNFRTGVLVGKDSLSPKAPEDLSKVAGPPELAPVHSRFYLIRQATLTPKISGLIFSPVLNL